MPIARMRMRPWLEKMIDSNAVDGLHWVDKEKMMFSIPWKHAARHGWELDKDASLFKMWAIHTGKYVEGQACDPKTWKANFRCAMNSLADIEEIKDRSINKGHQAVRVFKMLPVTPKCQDKRSRVGKLRQKKVKVEDDSSDSEGAPSPSQQPQQSFTPDSSADSVVPTELQDVGYGLSDSLDWSNTVEIDSQTYNHRFQVSPVHSTCPDDYSDYDKQIIEICSQLEKEREGEAHWTTSSSGNEGFLKSEGCTSPGSQWSEASSAEDLDELPQYTTLGTEFTSPTDDLWSGFYSSIFPMH